MPYTTTVSITEMRDKVRACKGKCKSADTCLKEINSLQGTDTEYLSYECSFYVDWSGEVCV